VSASLEEENLRCATLHLLTRGKMLRGIFAVASLLALNPNASAEEFISEVASLELAQCFTLIHDDLPALDNAKMRRGVEAVHIKFGEAVAILAGDALLNLAYQAIAQGKTDCRCKADLLDCLTKALTQVIEGQSLELSLSGRKVSLKQSEKIMSLKTASFIAASFEFGAILVGASAKIRSKFRAVGHHIGLAYQARDDLLSVTHTEQKLGKSVDADELLGRPTIVSVLGIDETRKWFEKKMEHADALIRELPCEKLLLVQLLEELKKRQK